MTTNATSPDPRRSTPAVRTTRHPAPTPRQPIGGALFGWSVVAVADAVIDVVDRGVAVGGGAVAVVGGCDGGGEGAVESVAAGFAVDGGAVCGDEAPDGFLAFAVGEQCDRGFDGAWVSRASS